MGCRARLSSIQGSTFVTRVLFGHFSEKQQWSSDSLGAPCGASGGRRGRVCSQAGPSAPAALGFRAGPAARSSGAGGEAGHEAAAQAGRHQARGKVGYRVRPADSAWVRGAPRGRCTQDPSGVTVECERRGRVSKTLESLTWRRGRHVAPRHRAV